MHRNLEVTSNLRRAARVGAMGLLVTLIAAPAVRADEPGPTNRRRTYIVEVFEANRDAVVNVNTTHIVRQRLGGFGDDPIFRRFFGDRFRSFERDVKRTSLGSGFIVHADGYIVTNAHVVDGADEIEVVLNDERHLSATVLASDASQDLAILKVEPPADLELKAVRLGDSSDLLIGEPVIAIGNPLGYEHSVTRGIVSAVGRSLPLTREQALEGLIQTDAAINPGNSGGPLLNAYGKVIGINTAIRGDAENIGFAISVNRLRDMISQLLSPMIIRKVALGGRLQERRRITGPDAIQTVLEWVADGDDAEARPVTHINGRPVSNIIDAYVALLDVEAGEVVSFKGPGGAFETTARTAPPHNAVRLAGAMMGVEVRQLSRAEARQLGMRRAGVLIEAVQRDGPAADAALRPGDVLVQVGPYRVSTLDNLASILGEAREGLMADIYVIRDGRIGRTRLRFRSRLTGSL